MIIYTRFEVYAYKTQKKRSLTDKYRKRVKIRTHIQGLSKSLHLYFSSRILISNDNKHHRPSTSVVCLGSESLNSPFPPLKYRTLWHVVKILYLIYILITCLLRIFISLHTIFFVMISIHSMWRHVHFVNTHTRTHIKNFLYNLCNVTNYLRPSQPSLISISFPWFFLFLHLIYSLSWNVSDHYYCTFLTSSFSLS